MFYIKQHDTAPVLQATLQGGSPSASAVDLTGASVAFHMKDGSGNVVINVAAVITDAAAGVVQHRWLSTHTANFGDFHGEFEVTYPDLRVETFPNSEDIPIVIMPDII